jgi:hypothetical protein
MTASYIGDRRFLRASDVLLHRAAHRLVDQTGNGLHVYNPQPNVNE